jgi:glycolate oxidase FAD binding subunit
MSELDLRSTLERELGPAMLSAAGDTPAGFVVEPSDRAALGSTLRILGEARARVRVRGNGTHDQLGNEPIDVAAILSTRGLCGVEELDTQDGVVRVRAGTSLTELGEAAAPHGWEVPLGAAGTASIGGTLATAAIGPRRLGQGPPRDCVLGLDVVLATGMQTRCGGRVVKNVTGFDMAKLYTGSFGALGVIEAAWLRLRPLPEAVAVQVASLQVSSDPQGIAIEAARRSTARCAALLDPSVAERIGIAASGDATLLVEFAGSEPGVRADELWLGQRCAAVPTELDRVDALGRTQARSLGEAGARARVALLPSGCGRVARDLRKSGAQLIVHAGVGLIYAEWSSGLDAVGVLEHIVSRARGEARFEVLPADLKRGRDVFGIGPDTRSRIERMRALKQQFDPAGMLNPGRFLGRL